MPSPTEGPAEAPDPLAGPGGAAGEPPPPDSGVGDPAAADAWTEPSPDAAGALPLPSPPDP